MSALEKRYRRNFFVAIVLHVALVGGVICWEEFVPTGRAPEAIAVQWVPAALLGEMPEGKGTGKGMYKAPEASLGEPASSRPGNSPSDESPAPKKPSANEIALPATKPAPKKPATTAKPAATSAKPTTAKTTTAGSSTAKTTSTTSGAGKAASADDIRRRFASALSSSADGTPYGDNRPAGGGTAKGGRIGSPDGSPDGVPEGIGQGTPGWRYYKHIHDVLYQAWDQTEGALDRKLVATVQLRIARDGSVAEATMRFGSGNRAMDESVMAAVRRVPRLDPPPDMLVRNGYAIINVNFSAEG
jgi:TonB family protein